MIFDGPGSNIRPFFYDRVAHFSESCFFAMEQLKINDEPLNGEYIEATLFVLMRRFESNLIAESWSFLVL